MVDLIRTFMSLNRDIIYFVYGLSFFVLGLGIALQSRYASRLELARSLGWLAAFGFAHGFHEWGDYFIPIQATYLSAAAVEALQAVRLILLALSFVFLAEFGVRLLGRQRLVRRLSLVNGGLFLAWLLVVFVVLPRTALAGQWINVADALARYAIGFPGGLLAAYGLRRHAHQRIAPLHVPHIVRSLRLAGITIAAYALFGGLIVAPVPFFPGNVLNSTWFEQVFLVPPPVPRSLLGLLMAITTLRALEIFDVETARRIEGLEREQILLHERSRLAREIHDGVLQKIYSGGLLIESTKNLVRADSPAGARLDQAVEVIDGAISDLRSNVLHLQPNPVERPLLEQLRVLAHDPRFRSFVDITLQADPLADAHFDPPTAEHIGAIVTEAMANAVRHARADRLAIRARRDPDAYEITVSDNGVGISPSVNAGMGLKNMRDRARLLGGSLSVEGSESGTIVRLRVPREAG